MKKKTLLFVCCLLCSVFVFTGCNQAPTPSRTNRWKDSETLTYDVSLATYTENDETKPYTYGDVAGATFAPSAANGTYTVQLTKADGKYRLESTFTVNETYQNKADILGLEDARDLIVSETETEVTITTSTHSVVTFRDYPKGTPSSSAKTVNGVYLYRNRDNKIQLVRNHFQAIAAYDEKQCTLTLNEYNAVSNAYDRALREARTVNTENANLLDNEQVFYTVRSVNMITMDQAQSYTFRQIDAVKGEAVEVRLNKAVTGTTKITWDGAETEVYAATMYLNKSGETGSPVVMYLDAKDSFEHGSEGTIYTQRILQMQQGHLLFLLRNA